MALKQLFVQQERQHQTRNSPASPQESQDPKALRFIDDFLVASYEVSDGAETPADTLYANYQASCESRQVGTVNATAFSVRVMNFYRGRGVQRDEVVTNDGKLSAIYRGLAPKLAQQPDHRSDLFLPTETPKAGTPEPVPSSVAIDQSTVSERKPTESHLTSTDRRQDEERLTTPVPIKDLSRDELIACIRELEIELGEPEGVIDEHWGMVDLQVWLKGLEPLRNTGRRHLVPMSAEERDSSRVAPEGITVAKPERRDGDFHVRATLTGDKPISRGVSWKQ